MAGFKSEVVKAQELHLASLMRDTERLTSNLGQIRSEIRCRVSVCGSGAGSELGCSPQLGLLWDSSVEV